MIRIIAPARLHFGLFVAEPDPVAWLTATGEALQVRKFGGVGLMVREPALILRAEVASAWSATGLLAERALGFAQRVMAALSPLTPDPSPPGVPGGEGGKTPLAFTIERAMPAHAGLGSGTQLGLAIARAIATLWNVPWTLADLARWSGRGLRSGLGLHGFAHGGFLVEAGKATPEADALLLARHDFPPEWAIVLIQLPGQVRMHGQAEQDAFAHLTGKTDVAQLARLVLLGLLPALLERDLRTFGLALHEFNRRAGEIFAPIQGGPYASAILAELIAELHAEGIAAGQSSWGPTVFAITEPERAERLAERLRGRGLEVIVTGAANSGAEVS
jgi:beta-RFAP synthase